MEIWKTIENFDKYEVSNYGNVRFKVIKRSKHENRPPQISYRLLRPCTKSGYATVQISNSYYISTRLVHRLVAKAFIPNPDNLPQVNHKDENTLNNNVENLEWCTNEYNSNYGTRNVRISNTSKRNMKLCKKVLQYDLKGNFIKEWDSLEQIYRECGFTKPNISKCCNNKGKTAYKYIWKFKQ